jgi:hypothetical protein
VAHQIVQVGHVCYEAGEKFSATSDTYMVLFQVQSQEDLFEIEMRLNDSGIETHKFYEPDNNFGYTALCSCPVTGKDRKLFRKYKLWS